MKKICSFIMMMVLALQFGLSDASAKSAPINVYVEGKQLQPDNAPYLSNGRTLIEVRSLFEAIGFTLAYNSKTREVTGTRDQHVLKLKLNSKTATINGKALTLDVAPTIKNGRTVVPLRFVGEAVGMDVSWHEKKREVQAKAIHFKEDDLEHFTRGQLGFDSQKLLLGIDLETFKKLDFYVGYPADFPYAVYFSTLDDLTYFKNVTSLSVVGSFPNLNGLAKLSMLESVDINNYGTLTSLAGLENKPNLKTASISSEGTVSSYKPLQTSTALELLHLGVTHSGQDGLSFLTKLPKLKNLSVSNMADGDVQYLNKLTSLTTLSIRNTPKLTTINGLTLNNVSSLSITGSNIKKIHLDSHFAKLEQLVLRDNPLQMIQLEADLPRLRGMEIDNNKLLELPDFSKAPNVNWLWAYDNQIETIKSIQHLKNLQWLGLSNNKVQDVQVLANMPSLQYISLRNNQISALPSLQQLSNLSELDLGFNDLQSLDGLQGLPMLMTLSIDHNRIESLQQVVELPNLRKLDVHGNPIHTVSNLETKSDSLQLIISMTEGLDFEQLASVAQKHQVTLYYDTVFEEQAKQFEQQMWQEGNYNFYATNEPAHEAK